MQQIVFFQIAVGLLNLTTTILPALRVYAIWGQSWICFIAVMSLGLVNVTTNIMYSPGLVTSAYSLAPEVPGCWYTPLPLLVPIQSSLETAGFACIIAQELLVLILTWIRTYKLRSFVAEEEVPNRLSSLLLRDGTIYFSAILALNVMSIVVYRDSSAVPSTGDGVSLIASIMQCMLLSRFMFGLREAYLPDLSDGTSHAVSSHAWSSICFTTRHVIGNIGAPHTDADPLDEWLVGTVENQEPLPPVVSGDPFTVGLIKEDSAVEIIALGDTSGSSERELVADENIAIEKSAV